MSEIALPARLSNFLTEEELKIVRTSVQIEPKIGPALEEICQSDATDSEVKEVVELTVIDPARAAIAQRQIRHAIEERGYCIVAPTVIFPDAHPGAMPYSYAYTIGLTKRFGQEILVGGLLRNTDLIAIVDHAAQELLQTGTLDTLSEDVIRFPDGRPLRTRIDRQQLSRVVGPYFQYLEDFFKILPEHEVLLIRLADNNNVLPGEEGYNERFVQPSLEAPQLH